MGDGGSRAHRYSDEDRYRLPYWTFSALIQSDFNAGKAAGGWLPPL